ncbi:MAG TPA: capsule assembly Wzi family protein [Longimicrobiaceae bacterium]|nr:capsule assembly Wzi family protein [Longimicrobiaceae bacterium]
MEFAHQGGPAVGVCGLLLLALNSPLPGQIPDTASTDPVRVQVLPTPGSDLEDRTRIAQLLGGKTLDVSLIRSPSAEIRRLRPAGATLDWAFLAPEVTSTWNSAIPFSMNDGAAWTGRGATTQLRLGAALRYSLLSLVLAPEFTHSENRSFAYIHAQDHELAEFHLPWYSRPPWVPWPRTIDLPVRFGERPTAEVTLGQSTLTLSAGPVAAGASTENQWWGPGIRNAIVMSNNAEGFPHLFLRTERPLRSRIGSFEGKWIVGQLSESPYFDTLPKNDIRSLSGMVVTFRPTWDPSLTVGYARTLYAPVQSRGAVPGRFADVATRWKNRNDIEADPGDHYDQVVSLFGRWVFPGDGLEVYGEWARHDLPSSMSELLEDIGYSQGYTLGTQWARPVRDRGTLRLQGEITYLEQNDDTRHGAPSYYIAATVPQGYTNRGQVIGAAIGPGGSSQWVAADYLAPAWSAGVFGGRIRWDNDSYYTAPRSILAWPFLGHDVSVLGGVRGRYSSRWFQVTAQLTTTKRYNYLFQNRGQSWETADDAVDVRNYTLQLGIVALGGGLRRSARTEAVLPPVHPTGASRNVVLEEGTERQEGPGSN